MELARGKVEDRPWGWTFGALALRGVTAQLTLVADGKRFRVAFRAGAIVGAHSPLASDAAARIALTSNFVSSTQVAEIVREQTAHPERDEIDVITDRARLSPEQALRLRRRTVAHRAARTFALERGDFIVEDTIDIPTVPGSELDARAVVYLGARQNLTEGRLGAELGQIGAWFQLKPEALEDLPYFGFTDVERPALELLATGASLAELEATGVEQRTVRAVVYALASCAAVTVEATPRKVPTAPVVPASAPPVRRPPRASVDPPTTPNAKATAPVVAPPSAPAPPRRAATPAPAADDDDDDDELLTLADTPSGQVTRPISTIPPLPRTTTPMPARQTTPPPTNKPPTNPPATRAPTTPPIARSPGRRLPSTPPAEKPSRPHALTAPLPTQPSTPLPRPGTAGDLDPPTNFRARRGSDPITTRRRLAQHVTPEQIAATRALIDSHAKLLEKKVDHFVLLGVARDAPDDAIRAAYFTLARQLHPDKLAAMGIADESRQAHRLFAQVNTAFATIGEGGKRFDYLQILARGGEEVVRAEQLRAEELARRALEAEEHYRKGEMSLRRDQLSTAVAEFKKAADLDPDTADYIGMLAWAQFCASPDKMAASQATRTTLERAVGMAPKAPTSRFLLGRVERMLGRDAEAQRHFKDVLKLSPGHAEASAELRVIEARIAQAATKKPTR